MCELEFEVLLLSQIPAVFSQPSEEKIVVVIVFSLRIVCLCLKSVLPPAIFVVMHVGLDVLCLEQTCIFIWTYTVAILYSGFKKQRVSVTFIC